MQARQTWRVCLALMSLQMTLGLDGSRGVSPAYRLKQQQQFSLTLDEARMLNEVDDLCELDDTCFNSADEGAYDEVDGGSGHEGAHDEVDNEVAMIKSTKCMPELTVVQLPVSDDPSLLFLPRCTRLLRCGGCCNHELFSCRPTPDGVKNVTLERSVFKHNGESRALKRQNMKHFVTVEKHTDCKCSCRVQRKDCHALQDVNTKTCRCECTNVGERQKCQGDLNKYYWNEDTCDCQCRSVLECTTGHIFDMKTCRCIQMNKKKFMLG